MGVNINFSKSVFLNPIKEKICDNWFEFIDNNYKSLQSIEKKIGTNPENFTPQKNNVLRFLKLDPVKIKVVILGQDPYPQPSIATGRAFEVKNLKSWSQKFRNASLKNILGQFIKRITIRY